MALLPCGVFFTSYQTDMAYTHTWRQRACLAAFLVFLFALPVIFGVRIIAMVNMAAIVSIAVVGLQITTGYAGQINLGQSAFMGMGAFVCASLAVNFNLPFWITIPAGGLGGAVLGIVFGIPALRIKGFYLAMTTIAAQIIFPLIIMHMPEVVFGGAVGLSLDPAKLGNITFDTDISLFYLIISVAVIMIFLAFNIVRGRIGRAMIAVRDNDIAAEIMGVNIFSYKTLAFAIGAMYAGIAGGLWAYYIRFVGADQFTLYFSVWYVGMIIVGGMGSILGAILGTIFIRGLVEILTVMAPIMVENFPSIGGPGLWFAGTNIILGGAIILFVIFEPRGLNHRWRIARTQFRIWPYPHL